MKIFYSETHQKHHPPFEIFDGGEKVPNFENPERAEKILSVLSQTSWAEIQAPEDFGLEPILAIHSHDYIEFLRNACNEWLLSNQAQPDDNLSLFPSNFPIGRWRHKPKSIFGRAGIYISDLSAPISSGTYEAALASTNCALSGAKDILAGAKTSFALCRPPGHHAGRAHCAGYCYINNAAVAANYLSMQNRTAILDIDYHAGNGTQDIFYERGDILTVSIHANPDFEYPYFSGFASETGEGAGSGFHKNFPLEAGCETREYVRTLKTALGFIHSFEPEFLVVSAGMDIFTNDPLGKFRITTAGIHKIGQEIANLGLKSLVCLEGGYNNSELGKNMLTFLEAFNRK